MPGRMASVAGNYVMSCVKSEKIAIKLFTARHVLVAAIFVADAIY